MAEKKLRKFETRRIKWYLLYIALVLLFIAALVATIIFMDSGIGKVLLIIYEAFIILLSFAFLIAIEVYWRIYSKKSCSKLHKKNTNNISN